MKNVAALLALPFVLLAALPAAGSYVPTPGEPVEDSHIVIFYEGDPAAQLAEDLAQLYGANVESVWVNTITGAHLTGMDPATAQQLAQDKRVSWVEEDAWAEPAQSLGHWGLDRVDQRDLPLDNSHFHVATGYNVHAYVIDSGIRSTHNEFWGRVSGGRDFVGDGYGTEDCQGHGTHVAGVLGGFSHGVAKEIQLHPVRVFGCWDGSPISRLIDAVEWVTINASFPAVANMSLEAPYSRALDKSVQASMEAGIYYAVAAGNDAVRACDVSPAHSLAHTVGATDSVDRRSSFSNYGYCVDLFAPGTGIASAWHTSDSATATRSGTSAATAHVTGVAALFLQFDPSMSVSQLKSEIELLATRGRLSQIGSGSPNLLLYSHIDFP